jgi:UDP-N-acetylglucosamine 2-epimerase (non-hydrolysing)
MAIFGTRPEAIKLAPVIKLLQAQNSQVTVHVCVTGQHRDMLDQVLNLFEIVPDYDLNVMTDGQDLFSVAERALRGLKLILEEARPDLVLVQGDTTTTFVASLAAFYLKIPIGHVEAGLRTYDKYHPFPEEKNRQLTTVLADYHFAPTERARNALIREGIAKDNIWITGNTAIDALLLVDSMQRAPEKRKSLEKYFHDQWQIETNSQKIILVTAHRRESFGEEFKNICEGLRAIASQNPHVTIVYPVHPNPNVREVVYSLLGNVSGHRNGGNHGDNIRLIDPLDYDPFVYLMGLSQIILTDSGGIQEEAPSLGKPVLVMRDTTERPEGIEAGNAKLVGTNPQRIFAETQRLLEDEAIYRQMSSKTNPYGDGRSAERIVGILSGHQQSKRSKAYA